VAGARTRARVAGAIGPYSLGVVASGSRLLFVAGQVAWDVDGRIVGKGQFGEQYRQVMRSIAAIVEDAGGTMSDVCKIVNYVTVPMTKESSEYAELIEARREFFPDRLPVSTLVEVVSLMDPDALVEVDAIAVLD
jgi:2-iminobutanoate/2-iminopropanoate deaminase